MLLFKKKFNSYKELVLEKEKTPLANFFLIIFTRWAVDLALEDEEGFSKFVAKLELVYFHTLYRIHYTFHKANIDNYLYNKNDQVPCFHYKNQLNKMCHQF